MKRFYQLKWEFQKKLNNEYGGEHIIESIHSNGDIEGYVIWEDGMSARPFTCVIDNDGNISSYIDM